MFEKINMRSIPELDSLRFLSILLVISHHLFLDQNIVLLWTKKYAWVGVDIFFVLSGFIITSILHKEFLQSGTINLKKFWLKRMIRLWPSWILILIISYPVVFYYSRNDIILRSDLNQHLWHYFFHFGNYSHAIYGKIHTLYSHFWSLAVEEHFYLIWPIIFLYLLKNNLKNLNKCLLLLFLTPIFFRLFHGHNHAAFAIIKLSTHTRFDELIMGCMLAININKLSSLSIKSEIFLTIAMFLFFYIGLNILDDRTTAYYLSSFNFTFISIASALLIIIATKGTSFGIRKILQNQYFSKIGILSYNIYLVHFLIISLTFGILSHFKFTSNQNLILAIVFLVTLLPAFLMYQIIDLRIEKWKSKIGKT